MNNRTTFAIVLMILVTNFLSFLSGKESEQRNNIKKEWEFRNQVANRYLLYFKSPSNIEEQCAFEFIAYGRCNEYENMTEEQRKEYDRKTSSYFE